MAPKECSNYLLEGGLALAKTVPKIRKRFKYRALKTFLDVDMICLVLWQDVGRCGLAKTIVVLLVVLRIMTTTAGIQRTYYAQLRRSQSAPFTQTTKASRLPFCLYNPIHHLSIPSLKCPQLSHKEDRDRTQGFQNPGDDYCMCVNIVLLALSLLKLTIILFMKRWKLPLKGSSADLSLSNNAPGCGKEQQATILGIDDDHRHK